MRARKKGPASNEARSRDAVEQSQSSKSSQAAVKLLPFHPLADMFPLLGDKDFDDLVKDIEQNTQLEDVDIYNGQIIDGRNRARACQRLGIEPRYHTRRFNSEAGVTAYIISKNIHRRHLTAEQKRDLIGKLITAEPTKSDTAHAKTAKVSKNTVAKVRGEMERRGQIDHVEKRTDTLGRSQPASKPKMSMPYLNVQNAKSRREDENRYGAAMAEKPEPQPKVEIPENAALIDFAKFTLANIESGHLKISADVSIPDSAARYRKWRDLKDRIEPRKST